MHNFRIIKFICILSIIYSTNFSLAADVTKTPTPPSGLKIGMDSIPYDPGYPYPPSTTIASLTWDWSSLEISGAGSDLWHIAWTTDGYVYTAWGDGGGPNVPSDDGVVCRTHMGIARTSSTPPGLSWSNRWGCKADGTGCQDWGQLWHDASCDAPYGGSLSDYGVPEVLFAVNNRVYVISSIQGVTEAKISYSDDGAASWTTASWVWGITTGGFHPSGFVTYGAGNAGARDGYAYLMGGKVGDIKGIYMARVPIGELMTQGSYQYFTGTSSSPSWGTWENATRIHYDASRKGPTDGPGLYNYVTSRMTYFPVINRYILMTNGGDIGMLRVYEAREPWGPWNTVYYSDTWGNFGPTHALYYNVIPKFTSSDNKTFWMTFSAGGGPVDYDKYHLIKGTFTLAADLPPE